MHTQLADVTAACPYCLQPLLADDSWEPCASCKRGHHRDCREELGGCAVYGCSLMVPVRKPDEVQNFWGSLEKQCPVCAETIAVADLTCPHCGEDFDTVRPVTRDQVLGTSDPEPPTPLRRIATILLALSILGVTSPLVLIGGGIWYAVKREAIAREGPATRAIALIALGVAALYLTLIGLGTLAFQAGSNGAEGTL